MSGYDVIVIGGGAITDSAGRSGVRRRRAPSSNPPPSCACRGPNGIENANVVPGPSFGTAQSREARQDPSRGLPGGITRS
jgi:hypothetical protein